MSSMELAKLVILVECSALGVAVSLLLTALLLRQKNADAGARIGIVLGVCVFGMYAGTGEFAFCSFYRDPIPAWVSHLLLWILAFLPGLIVWSWRKSPVLRWESKISTWLVAAALSSGCAVVLISHWFGPHPSRSQNFLRLLALHRAVCLAPAIISIVRLPLDARLKTFVKATSVAYLAASSINIIRIPGMDYTSLSGVILIFIAQACGLCGVLGSFIVVARFRLVDVFLRWSTRITVLGVLSILVTLSFNAVVFDVGSPRRGVGLLGCAFETIVLLLIGIILSEKCERWVESYVLQRTDLKAEVARLHARLFMFEDKEELFKLVEEELAHTLELREAKVLPCETIPREVLALQILRDDPVEIPARIGPLSIGGLREIEVLIPIPAIGEIHEMIGISTGAGRRSLHSGEIRFLLDIGHQLGVRLHLLKLEAASRRQALRESILRHQLTEAELRALRAQVNPHFLFNSLNTIADLIVRDPVNAERMTMRLSGVFRHVLAQADRQFVTLAEEFSFLRNYLGIEQERFGESLQVSFEMEPHVAQVSVPTLLLQPLVENALKHGLAPKGGERSLRVVAAGSMENVLLQVIDNGIGFPGESDHSRPSKSRRSGVGLENTRARLQAVYGDEGKLLIESLPMQGSRVSLSLPNREVRA